MTRRCLQFIHEFASRFVNLPYFIIYSVFYPLDMTINVDPLTLLTDLKIFYF